MIDLLASERHYGDHLLPVWTELPAEVRGTAYLPKRCAATVAALKHDGYESEVGGFGRGQNDVFVAAWQDEWRVHRSRPDAGIYYLEHGAGQVYTGCPEGAGHRSYSGGSDHRNVRLFLSPSETVADRWRTTYPEVPAVAVGCPKLDASLAEGRGVEPRQPEGRLFSRQLPYQLGDPSAEGAGIDPARPLLGTRPDSNRVPSPLGHPSEGIVAVSFHADYPNLCAEASGCWGYYDDILPALAERFRLLGHGHPRLYPHLTYRWDRLGIEKTPEFADVLDRAAVYVCDNSSTLPEFASTGRPVIFLNGPQYRRDVHHQGRFWEWPNVLGPACDTPEELPGLITHVLANPREGAELREKMLDQIYAFRDGRSSGRAVAAIMEVASG